MIDENDTQPVVSPQRLQAASNVVLCLGQARLVAHSAGEWAAGAIGQIEDPHFRALVADSVDQWHKLEQRWLELQLLGRYRMEALKAPPRVTRRPGGAS